MRLSVSKSSNAVSYYVIRSVYENGRHTSRVVKKLGTEKEIRQLYPDRDPKEWAQEQVDELNRQEALDDMEIIQYLSTSKRIPANERSRYNGGYLILQSLYHQLKLDKICSKISSAHNFQYDLNDILLKLICARIMEPCSKRSSFESVQSFLEPPNFELHQIYRALEVLAQEAELIQSQVYKNSLKVASRNTKILYYDCTTYFFEIEEASGFKQYGLDKQHRPNPIVQMGLFLDGSGLPLAFSINPGNTNEQTTLRPLEEKILKDYGLSQFVVCTDAGLSSTANRRFNSLGNKAFVTTQSIKRLKGFLKEWALDPAGWKLPGSRKTYDLSSISEEDPDELNRIYYKSRPILENGLEQDLIVTYSLKYKRYTQSIRDKHVERALKLVDKPSKLKSKKSTDPKRLIREVNATVDGEVADQTRYYLDEDIILEEAQYDGFYAVCTNLEADPMEIIEINRGRWEIEAAFRTMKSEFKSRPVYLRRDDRILAHFLVCFLSLLIYRIVSKQTLPAINKARKNNNEEAASGLTLIKTLKDMEFHRIDAGYVPLFTRTDITDHLLDQFNFRLDTECVPEKRMKEIFRRSRKG